MLVHSRSITVILVLLLQLFSLFLPTASYAEECTLDNAEVILYEQPNYTGTSQPFCKRPHPGKPGFIDYNFPSDSVFRKAVGSVRVRGTYDTAYLLVDDQKPDKDHDVETLNDIAALNMPDGIGKLALVPVFFKPLFVRLQLSETAVGRYYLTLLESNIDFNPPGIIDSHDDKRASGITVYSWHDAYSFFNTEKDAAPTVYNAHLLRQLSGEEVKHLAVFKVVISYDKENRVSHIRVNDDTPLPEYLQLKTDDRFNFTFVMQEDVEPES